VLLIFPAAVAIRLFGNKTAVKLWLYVVFVTTAFASFPSPASALNPDRKISQYAHSAWRLQDGFFGNPPTSITQTTDGYIWIGTQSGIFRFDGVRFVPWSPAGGEALQNSRVLRLLGTSDGSLWIGTDEHGLWRWYNHKLSSYLDSGAAAITAILEDRSGSIWVGRTNVEDGAGRVCEIRSGVSHCYSVMDKIGVQCCTAVAEDREGNLWFGGGAEFTVWKPHSSSLRTFTLSGANPHAGSVANIQFAPDASAWIGIGQPGHWGGLQHFVHGRLSAFRTATWDSSKEAVYRTLLDRNGALWVGTAADGVYRIHNGSVDHFSAADGLSGDGIFSFFEDREGNVWVATFKGIDCFRDLAVSSFSAREGLGSAEVDSVLGSRARSIWAGGDGSLDHLDNGKIESIQTNKGLPGVQVTSLLEDHAGKLWVGIDQKLSILDGRKFTEIKRPNGQALGFVVGIAEDIEDNVWAEISGSPRELVRIENSEVKEIFPAPAMPAARKVAADPQGGIWLGLMSGDLARYRKGKLDTFHFPHRLDSRVEQVSVEDDGEVLGATGFGLIGWRDGKQQTLTEQNGLPCSHVNSFVKDKRGALWLYTQCGLIEIPSQEVEKWWEHSSAKLQIRIFDSMDGVRPGFSPFQGAARSQDGKLWFANESVLQMIDPEHMTVNRVPPPVHIEEVIAENKNFSSTNDPTLPALTRNVSVRYTALSFIAPQRVLFRYMLEGQDKAWQDAGTRREAFYTNLGPGTYRFHVIACNNDGVWNQVGDTFSFIIAPAYYQTGWFGVLCALTAAMMLWLIYLLRLRHAREQIEQRLGARLEERERISRELHDTLLQGFQGLMLRFQAVMKMLPAHEPAHELMEKVMDRADEVLLEGRQSVQGLRRLGASGDDLAEALRQCSRELAEDNADAFSLAVLGTPVPIDPIIFDEVYRIAREALLNALQHSRATKIEVELTYSSSQIVVRIRDDGTGIDPAILSTGRTGHWGLSGMRERAQKIGAKLNIWSHHGAGTEIELAVRVKAPSSNKGARPFSRRHPHREQ
jgi:signal transduction histidine kinase/ligand-binding sensor domain-containing protein